MNILKVLFLTAVLSWDANAKQVKIAVIDTGYTKPTFFDSVNLCDSGHFDATTGKNEIGADSSVKDIENHGTHIAHVIDDRLKPLGKNKYCLVIFKIYGNKNNVVEASIKVLNKIKNSDIEYVNYSTAGEGYDAKEHGAIKQLLNKGVVISAAAGNRNISLDSKNIYPAMYDPRIFVVGNGLNENHRYCFSNYGKTVKNWVNGSDILAGGFVKSGTSQATAIFTARLVYDNIVYVQQNFNKRK